MAVSSGGLTKPVEGKLVAVLGLLDTLASRDDSVAKIKICHVISDLHDAHSI